MRKTLLAACIGLMALPVQGGVINPDCDAGKAAKSAAMKATVGIGGRCDPKEALADSVGLDDKKGKVSDSKDALKDGKENVTDTLDKPTNKLIKKAVN
jgi:hypothetical protein